jgi:hypothetical protein
MDAALQDFEVFALRAWHVKVGKLVRRARQPMTDQQFTSVLLHLRILIALLGFMDAMLRAREVAGGRPWSFAGSNRYGYPQSAA